MHVASKDHSDSRSPVHQRNDATPGLTSSRTD